MNRTEHSQSYYKGAGRPSVIYVRISDEKQKKKGDGIQSQETACRTFAQYNNMRVDKVFVDVISGKYASRPAMVDMLDFLDDHRADGYAVIIDDVSRIARNYVAHVSIRQEINSAGGELFSPTMEFSDDPTRQMPEKIVAIVKEQERIDNADRTLRRQISRMKNGYYTFRAPTGYKHIEDPSGRGGKVLVVDQPVAGIVKEALEQYAYGILSSKAEVKRFLESNPAFPVTKSGEIGKDRVTTMLTQPIYAGYIDYKPWNISMVEGQHDALISLENYLKIQDRLNGKIKAPAPVRLSINPEFPLRGLVVCDCCGTPLTAANSQGRSRTYAYFSCRDKACTAYGKSIPKDDIERGFVELVEELTPTPELVKLITMMFRGVWEKHASAFKLRHDAAARNAQDIQKKKDALMQRLINATQPAIIEAYEAEIVNLETRHRAAQEKIDAMQTEKGLQYPDFEEAYRTTLRMISKPLLLWDSGKVSHRRLLAKLAFRGDLHYDRNSGYRTPKPSAIFQFIQSLNGKKDSLESLVTRMVGDTGIEPVTPAV